MGPVGALMPTSFSGLMQEGFWVSHSNTQPADPGMLGEGVL